MNSLIVYDSQFGNTEKIALQIAGTLREFGTARAVRVTLFEPGALGVVELLVVGGPTQAWHSTASIRDFLAQLDQADVARLWVAEFDTRFDKPRWLTGSSARAIAKQWDRLGARSLLPPESFFVLEKEGPLESGELERAARWAHTLRDEYVRVVEQNTVTA